MCALPSVLTAQTVFLNGAATVPTGDYGDFASTGLMRYGGALFPLGDGRISLGADAFWGSNDHDIEGEESNLFGVRALMDAKLDPAAPVTPFVFAGLGLMVHAFESDARPSSSDTGLTGRMGVGLELPLGRMRGVAAASYNLGFTGVAGTDFLGIGVGGRITLGGPTPPGSG